MASTTIHSNAELIKFGRDIFAKGYIRENRFFPYTGTSTNAVIRNIRDLAADGKEIRVPLLDVLNGTGKSAGTLVGNEEALDTYGCPMWADFLRHGVTWKKNDAKDAAVSFKSIAAPELSRWYKKRVKEETVDALASIPSGAIPTGRGGDTGNRINGIKWSDATAAQKNAWVTANSDRVVFGAALANYSTTAATALGNVDTTSDRASSGIVSMAKRVAMATTGNKITPYVIEENMQEQYLMFVGARAMRDLRNDTAIKASLTEMIVKSKSDFASPLFRNGDIMWDNVIITEIPEIDERLTLTGVGYSSSDVVPCFLCGTSALAYVTGQMPRPTSRKEDDYDFLTGVGIEGQYGIGKVYKAPAGSSSLKDWGMVTVFVSSVADA